MARRKKDSPRLQRTKINLTIHPDVQKWAKILARRRTVGQFFEDLVEAEWLRQQRRPLATEIPPAPPQPPLQHQIFESEAQALANYRYRQTIQPEQ